MEAYQTNIDDGSGKKVLFAVHNETLHVIQIDSGGANAMTDKIEQVAGAIAGVCKSIRQRIMNELKDNAPSEITCEFGVTLAGEQGIPCITSASIETSFKVSAKWTFDKAKP